MLHGIKEALDESQDAKIMHDSCFQNQNSKKGMKKLLPQNKVSHIIIWKSSALRAKTRV